ncbi:MAG: hypothetical protein ACOVNY_02785 [Chitinophagaceae bacterium]
MQPNSTNIFFSQEYIQQYINGKLSKSDMYAFENAMLQDDALADAVEGFKINNNPKLIQENLDAITEKILASTKKQSPIFTIYQNKWFNIAAICLLIILASVIAVSSLKQTNNTTNNIAQVKPKKTVKKIAVDSPYANQKTVAIQQQLVVTEKIQPIINQPKKDVISAITDNNSDDIILPAKPKTQEQEDAISMALANAEEAQSNTIASRNDQKVDSTILAKETISANQSTANLTAKTASKDVPIIKSRSAFNNLNQIDDKNINVIEIGKRKKATENNTAKRDVITGIISTAKPVNGWENYNQYLQEKLHFLADSTIDNEVKVTNIHGKEVELEFKIDKNGNPVNVAITKNTITDTANNHKIINILTTGPKFNVPTNKKNNKAKMKIKY